MVDRYPLMTVHYAIAALRARFGCERVTCESHEITIKLQAGQTSGPLLVLTAEQAKYLVAHPISSDDLVNEKYPADWPRSTGGPKRLPPGRPVHGEIAPVAFGPDTALALLSDLGTDSNLPAHPMSPARPKKSTPRFPDL